MIRMARMMRRLAPPARRVSATLVVAGTLAAMAGCSVPRGLSQAGLPEPPRDAIAIAIVGGAAGDGADATATARALSDRIARARADDRDAIVLLPGGYANEGAASPVVAQVVATTERVGTRFAIASPDEPRNAGAIRATTCALVRVGADGRGETLSSCDGPRCTIAAAPTPGVVDLVLLDLGPWWAQNEETAAANARMTSLLGSIDRADTTPRILVLAEPVEGAFERGAGAQRRRHATFHTLPPVLRDAIATGVFVGVIAGGERSTHATADLGPVIQRSDRTWLAKPVWQVVSGNATDPVRGRGGRRSLWQRGTLYLPDVASFSGGFAVAWIHGERIDLDVVAHEGRRWRTGRVSLPLRPAAKPQPATMPHLTPCPRCDDFPANERP